MFRVVALGAVQGRVSEPDVGLGTWFRDIAYTFYKDAGVVL